MAVHVLAHEKCRDLYLAGSFVMPALTQNIVTKIFETQRAEAAHLMSDEITVSERISVVRSSIHPCHSIDE